MRPFSDGHSDWIAAYAEHDPTLGEALSTAWQVSGVDDGVLLIHPAPGTSEEWTASLFANWVPGLARYESFLDLVTHYADL